MKTFSISTKSESGDDYLYHVRCEHEPTDEQIEKFLIEYGNDKDEDGTYENVLIVLELEEENIITIN